MKKLKAYKYTVWYYCLACSPAKVLNRWIRKEDIPKHLKKHHKIMVLKEFKNHIVKESKIVDNQ